MKEKPYKDNYRPVFNNFKVYVLPGANYALTLQMFAQQGFEKADSVDDADLVCFVGGADVDPSRYQQEPYDNNSYYDTQRDAKEAEVYRKCMKDSIPMVGICRGAQFLHVMCGGELWQDVDNHTRDHDIIDIEWLQTIPVSSTHHQMMKINDEMSLIATTVEPVATYFVSGRDLKEKDQLEVEACSYEEHAVLCVQGHPEFPEYREFRGWFFHKLADCLYDWRDTIRCGDLVDFITEENEGE